MAPSPAVAEKLCCTAADTDSRSNSPLPFRRHSQQPTAGMNPTTQQPLLHRQDSARSHTEDDLIELQHIFAEAGSTLPPTSRTPSMLILKHPRSRPETTVQVTEEGKHGKDAPPKKKKFFKRLTRELSKSHLSLSNLKKAAATKDKEKEEQQEAGEKKPNDKGKVKEKKKANDDDTVVEQPPTNAEAKEVLLSRTYDSDAASLPDIRDSFVERLTKTVALAEDNEDKARRSLVKSRGSTDRRGNVQSIDWSGSGGGFGGGRPYGWDEPSSSAPILSVRIPQCSADLGVLPSCNVSVEDFQQLYQPSGRNSPWKKFAQQHLRQRSKSTSMLVPSSPDLKPVELPNLSLPFRTQGWLLSTDEPPKLPANEAKHTTADEKADEERHDDDPSAPRPTSRAPTVSPIPTHPASISTYRTVSEILPPPTDYHSPVFAPSSHAARRASLLPTDTQLPDSEAASLHLHDMRISQHLRSESTLSATSGGTAAAQSHLQPKPSEQLSVTPAVRTRVPGLRRGSSSGFASERVPEGWGNVVSAAPSSVYGVSEKGGVYEPSSVYSTRQNSLAGTPTVSRVNVESGQARKSGYAVLDLGDVGALKMEGDEEGEGEEKMPGAFPPSSPLKEPDAVLTAETLDRAETYQTARESVDRERGKLPVYETSDPSDQSTETGEETIMLKPNEQSFASVSGSSNDITPVTATESPAPSEKTPRASIVTPGPSKQPEGGKDKIKSPSKRFSTFSFFRSKTYANLRRAAHSPALHARKDTKSDDQLVFDGQKDVDHTKASSGHEITTDGPNDEPTPKDSMASEAIEDHQPGRLSRSLMIDHGRDKAYGQGAVWERALQKHREERSALFLSPEKGGKAEARALYRERSGSGSAVSARSKQSDRKGKGPAIGDDFRFTGFGSAGEGSSKLQRSPTILLDPLEMGFGEELERQSQISTSMLGDELRHSQPFGSLTPGTGISPGASVVHRPSVESIEADVPHVDSWGGTTLAEIDVGDLGPWGRYPSHTREERTGPAGDADDIRTRDFAYESMEVSALEDDSSNEEDEQSQSAIKRFTTLQSKGRSKSSRSGMQTSKSMTFSRNFSFLKHYIGLFRSQSEEFRKYGHGHRSSIAEGGTLEHPELEILPPVFSPVMFDSAEFQTDGAGSKADLTVGGDNQHHISQDGKPESKLESEVPLLSPPKRREERGTDSSDTSWKANARLWTHTFGSETDKGKEKLRSKADSSTEWWSNARAWTRYNTPKQSQGDGLDDPKQRAASTPLTSWVNQLEERINVPGKAVQQSFPKRSKRTHQSSSEEWRSDARLYSQMYESCVQIPNFSSSDEANASDTARASAHRRSPSAATAFRVASTGHLDRMVSQAAANAMKRRAMSSSFSSSTGQIDEQPARNDSVLNVNSVKNSTMDLMRFLEEVEESERAKLEGEKA